MPESGSSSAGRGKASEKENLKAAVKKLKEKNEKMQRDLESNEVELANARRRESNGRQRTSSDGNSRPPNRTLSKTTSRLIDAFREEQPM